MSTQHTPPPRRIELLDLTELAHQLPPTGVELVRVLGAAPALALLQRWPGVQMVVPMPLHTYTGSAAAWHAHAAARWVELEAVIGELAMPALVKRWGGLPLDVPICHLLLNEKRDRWIRRRFDALTTQPGKLSAAKAMREISLELSEAGQPMTTREIGRTLDRWDIQPPRVTQGDLFEGMQ